MTKAEEKAIEYADKALEYTDAGLAASGYKRHNKMKVVNMCGYDVENAYLDGYEQAEKDTIERAIKWLFAHLSIIIEYFPENADFSEQMDRSDFLKVFRKAMER